MTADRLDEDRPERWDGRDTEDSLIAKMFHGSRCHTCSAPLRSGLWSWSVDDDDQPIPVCSTCSHVCVGCGGHLSPRCWTSTDLGPMCQDCNRLIAHVVAEANALVERRRRAAAAKAVVAAAMTPVEPRPEPRPTTPDDLTLARSRRHWQAVDAAFAAARTHPSTTPKDGGGRPGDLAAAARQVLTARTKEARP